MGGRISRQKKVVEEERKLKELQQVQGENFPGADFHAEGLINRKEWMLWLWLSSNRSLKLKEIMWPGSHDSATNQMGLPLVSRPLVECQDCSIYDQLVKGTRVFDIRIEERMHVCHSRVRGYKIDVVVDDIKRFLSETQMEIIVLEIRTEFGRRDPPALDEWLIQRMGIHLVPPSELVFDKTLGELMPQRVFCIWKPSSYLSSPPPPPPLWSGGFLTDDWTDTDLPETKFWNNMEKLEAQPPVEFRRYFYRVENTATPQADALIVCVKPVTNRIRGFARLFISQAFRLGLGDRLQIFSCDFIDEDFVDVCIGVTLARMQGRVK